MAFVNVLSDRLDIIENEKKVVTMNQLKTGRYFSHPSGSGFVHSSEPIMSPLSHSDIKKLVSDFKASLDPIEFKKP